MDERLLTAGAILIEFGLPLWLCLLMRRRPAVRPKAVVVLGALFPLLAIYAWLVAAYCFTPDDPGARFAIFAAWVMTFIAYVGAALVGFALSFLRKPGKLWARFAMGLASVLVVAMVIRFSGL